MNSENDELRTQLARLKALPVGDPPPLSELRRRIERFHKSRPLRFNELEHPAIGKRVERGR